MKKQKLNATCFAWVLVHASSPWGPRQLRNEHLCTFGERTHIREPIARFPHQVSYYCKVWVLFAHLYDENWNHKHTSHYVGTSRLRLILIFRIVPDMQFEGLLGLVSCLGSDIFLLFTLQMICQYIYGSFACKLELRYHSYLFWLKDRFHKH